jgi:PPK2 family polyphosphate:nucleotide phosphotransferase
VPNDLVKRARRLSRPYRVEDGRKLRLADRDPADTGGLRSKAEARKLLAEGVEALRECQERLYAQDRWAVLLVFQAIDAAGKDSTIGHVMSGVNPQGVQVHSFKAPSVEELGHDFLWRTSCRLPERGRIGIFNRSYYEEVLVVRVHPELLEAQRLPPALAGKRIWEERFDDIVAHERHLARSGTLVLKFFLHVSKGEQKRRFLERIDRPSKRWKFSLGDVKERERWRDYQGAYEEMIKRTATPWAPWYVVPADAKWFTRLVVAAAVVDALEGLGLDYPELPARQREELALAREALLGQDGRKARPAR